MMSRQPDDDLENRRLHHELEQVIKTINHKRISEAAGEITKTDFTNVVEMVASLRARYLHAVIQMGQTSHHDGVDPAVAEAVKDLREAYIEAKEGFGALQHALQRGYFSLSS